MSPLPLNLVLTGINHHFHIPINSLSLFSLSTSLLYNSYNYHTNGNGLSHILVIKDISLILLLLFIIFILFIIYYIIFIYIYIHSYPFGNSRTHKSLSRTILYSKSFYKILFSNCLAILLYKNN